MKKLKKTIWQVVEACAHHIYCLCYVFFLLSEHLIYSLLSGCWDHLYKCNKKLFLEQLVIPSCKACIRALTTFVPNSCVTLSGPTCLQQSNALAVATVSVNTFGADENTQENPNIKLSSSEKNLAYSLLLLSPSVANNRDAAAAFTDPSSPASSEFSETDSVPPRRLCWRCLCLPILREQRRGDIKKLPACFKHNDVTNDKGWTGASGMHPKSLEDDEWLYHARAAYFNIACASWWAQPCQIPEKQGWNVLNLLVSRSLNPSLCWIYYTKAIDQYFGGKDACLIYDTTLNECINHKLSCLSHE